MLCNARQTKSKAVQICADRLYASANDAFAKVDKGVVESQLVDFFIYGVFHDYLRMEVMREILKLFRILYNLHGLNKKLRENVSAKNSRFPIFQK